MRTVPADASWGLYFAGRYIFDAVVGQLVAMHGLGDATEIILSGDSAGGIGTWYHLDRLASRFPRARVVGAPVAGFYFYVSHGSGVTAVLEEGGGAWAPALGLSSFLRQFPAENP